MRTRSQRVKQEEAGIPPSPPRQLPETRRPTRATRTADTNGTTTAPTTAPTTALTKRVANTRAPRARASRKAPGSAQQALILQDTNLEDVVNSTSEASEFLSPPLAPPSPRAPFVELAPTALNALPSPAPATAPSPKHGPSVPQCLIHFWVDPTLGDLAATRPSTNPDVVMAVPASVYPELMQLIAARRTGPKLTSVIASSISISPTAPQASNKRKLAEDAVMSRPAQRARVESPTPSRIINKKKTTRGVFSRMPFEPLSHNNAPAVIWSPPTPSDQQVLSNRREEPLLFPLPQETVAIPSNVSPDLINEEQISENARNEQNMVVQPQIPAEQVPEIPRANTWGLNSLINSARSVSKYLPGFTSRPTAVPFATQAPLLQAPIVEAPVVQAPSVEAPIVEATSTSNPNPISTPPQIEHYQISTQTEPQDRTRSMTFAGVPSTPTTNRIQPQQQSSRKSYRSKVDIEASRKRKAERNTRRAQAAATMEEDARKAKESQNQKNAKMTTKTGGKRKRLPSPDTIPNPPGTSYGMDLDYFGWISSDEFSEDEEPTPTKARPNKSRRLSKPDDRTELLLGDPKKARPYTGAYFPDTSPTYQGGNVFEEVFSAEKARAQAAAQKAADELKQKAIAECKKKEAQEPLMRQARKMHHLWKTPSPPKVFRVPSPHSSDSDSETSPEDSIGHRRTSTTSEKLSGSKGSAGRETPKESVTSPKTKRSAERHNSKVTVASPKTKGSAKIEPINSISKSPSKGGARSQTTKRVTDPSATKGVLESTTKGNATPQSNETMSITKANTPQAKAPETWKQPPPPRPTPSHAALPSVTSKDSHALAIARKKALKHQPLRPSGLRESSRLSSPISASEIGAEGDSAAGSQKTPIVEETTKALVGCHEISSSNVDHGVSTPVKSVQTSEGNVHFNAYDEYCKFIDPKVAALLNATLVDLEAMKSMTHKGVAVITAKSAVQAQQAVKNIFSSMGPIPIIKRRSYTTNPEVSDLINKNWTEAHAKNAAEAFEELYAVWKPLFEKAQDEAEGLAT